MHRAHIWRACTPYPLLYAHQHPLTAPEHLRSTQNTQHNTHSLPDLVREVSKEMPDVMVDFMKASSYGAASESTGDVQVKHVSDLTKWDHYHILLVSSC